MSHIALPCLVPYGALLASIVSLILTRNVSLQRLLAFLAMGVAFYYKRLDLQGLGLLVILGGASFGFSKMQAKTLVHKVMFLGISLMTVLIYTHKMSGFHNCLVINGMRLSADALPYYMYFNFDKALAAVMIMVGLEVQEKQGSPWMTSQIFKNFVVCIGSVLLVAYLVKYVKWCPKVPSILWLWAVNNLLVVCFAENLFFRGFVQNILREYLPSKWIAIGLAAALYGLSAYAAGPYYMLLVFIVGLFYGHAYATTGRLLTPMVFQFALNLTHLLLFTYPALRG